MRIGTLSVDLNVRPDEDLEFKVGDRVEAIADNPRGHVGTVVDINYDIYCVAFDNWSGGHWGDQPLNVGPPNKWWMLASELRLVSGAQQDSQPTVGATVARLREAAGLPPFMVGDRVIEAGEPDDGVGTIIAARNDTYTVRWDRFTDPQYGWPAIWLTLHTPALTTTTPANDNRQPRFAINDWVRDDDGDIAMVHDYDPDDETYFVLGLDDDSWWAWEQDLEPWRPRVGEHVVITSDEFGEDGDIAKVDHVFGSVEASVTLCRDDEESTIYSVEDLGPSLPPSPAKQRQEYKVGDTVVVKCNNIFYGGVKTGSLGVVTEVSDSGRLYLQIDGCDFPQVCSTPQRLLGDLHP